MLEAVTLISLGFSACPDLEATPRCRLVPVYIDIKMRNSANKHRRAEAGALMTVNTKPQEATAWSEEFGNSKSHDMEGLAVPVTVDAAVAGRTGVFAWLKNAGIVKLNLVLFLSLISSYATGFDSSMMNGLQSLDTWKAYFNNPDASDLALYVSQQAHQTKEPTC